MGRIYYEVQNIPLVFSQIRGSLFRGTMPWGLYDTEENREYSDLLNDKQVNKVIVLVTDLEIDFASEKTSPNAIEFYNNHNITHFHFPFPDGGVPANKDDFANLISMLYQDLSQGENVLVHCMGGVGRTGLVISCLVKFLFSIDEESLKEINLPEDNQSLSTLALEYVRKSIPGAVETQNQKNYLDNFMNAKDPVSMRPQN